MFYGGKLLSHLHALPPGDSQEASISLLSINRNAAIVIDSDRHPGTLGGRKPRMNLNKTKLRIKEEIIKIGGFVWITEGREIENYVPIKVYARAVGSASAPKIDAHTPICTLPLLKKFNEDKIEIAHTVSEVTTKDDLIKHLDLWARFHELCARIEKWNSNS